MILLQSYISQVQEIHPDFQHPSIEWLCGFFNKTPSVLQMPATKPTPLNMGSCEPAVESIFDECMSSLEQIPKEHTHHKYIAEVANRP